MGSVGQIDRSNADNAAAGAPAPGENTQSKPGSFSESHYRMTYKDIFEFQDKNPTREERLKAFSTMTESEAVALIGTCGTPQGKLHYSNMYRSAKQEAEKDRK